MNKHMQLSKETAAGEKRPDKLLPTSLRAIATKAKPGILDSRNLICLKYDASMFEEPDVPIPNENIGIHSGHVGILRLRSVQVWVGCPLCCGNKSGK